MYYVKLPFLEVANSERGYLGILTSDLKDQTSYVKLY